MKVKPSLWVEGWLTRRVSYEGCAPIEAPNNKQIKGGVDYRVAGLRCATGETRDGDVEAVPPSPEVP